MPFHTNIVLIMWYYLYILYKYYNSSIVGSVVECSPATRAARVRFPDDAISFCEIVIHWTINNWKHTWTLYGMKIYYNRGTYIAIVAKWYRMYRHIFLLYICSQSFKNCWRMNINYTCKKMNPHHERKYIL